MRFTKSLRVKAGRTLNKFFSDDLFTQLPQVLSINRVSTPASDFLIFQNLTVSQKLPIIFNQLANEPH